MTIPASTGAGGVAEGVRTAGDDGVLGEALAGTVATATVRIAIAMTAVILFIG
jgi:hypothetical protein